MCSRLSRAEREREKGRRGKGRERGGARERTFDVPLLVQDNNNVVSIVRRETVSNKQTIHEDADDSP